MCTETIAGLMGDVADVYFYNHHTEIQKMVSRLQHLEKVTTPHRVLLCLRGPGISYLANVYYNDFYKSKQWLDFHQLYKLK